MYCSICHRYSSNPGEVNSKVFSINGYQRTFTVCKDKPHSEEQRILTDMVNKQEAAERQRQEATKQEARKLLELEEKRQQDHEAKLKEEIREKEYKANIRRFNEHYGNAKARAEIYKALKEAYESEHKE